MELGQNSAREDIMRGDGTMNLLALLGAIVSSKQYALVLDATNGRFQLHKVSSSTGADSGVYPQLDMNLSDVADTESTGIIKFRKVFTCETDDTGALVLSGGNPVLQSMYVLATAPVNV